MFQDARLSLIWVWTFLSWATSGQYVFSFWCEFMIQQNAGKNLWGYCVVCQLAQQPSPPHSVVRAGKDDPRRAQTLSSRSDWPDIAQQVRNNRPRRMSQACLFCLGLAPIELSCQPGRTSFLCWPRGGVTESWWLVTSLVCTGTSSFQHPRCVFLYLCQFRQTTTTT